MPTSLDLATPKSRSFRWPRRIVALAIGAILACAILFLLSFVLPVAAAWHHYRATPDFETYVASHPVPESELRARVASGVRLGEAGEWSAGDIVPPSASEEPGLDHDRATVRTRLVRGDELLCEVVQQVSIASARGTGDRRGVSVRTPYVRVRPGFRVFATAYVSQADRLVGPGSARVGRVDFDVVLASGEGEDELAVTSAAAPAFVEGDAEPSLDLDRGLLGFVHPRGVLPEAGLLHHVRTPIHLTWRHGESSSSSASYGQVKHALTTEEYSYELIVETAEEGMSRSTRFSRVYTWNGRIW